MGDKSPKTSKRATQKQSKANSTMQKKKQLRKKLRQRNSHAAGFLMPIQWRQSLYAGMR